ncbi:hypothetical protein FHL15_003481 [Xylaria flabelliformis]|uniref:Transcription factor domain-containing protein n=1 Tax=Xylaria flabelliformis TaxID=2512241 RepID=A0A553I5P4_9PEZI|nr:hypothetical protein FHL15_003481 [Xylaria flabelliformis]
MAGSAAVASAETPLDFTDLSFDMDYYVDDISTNFHTNVPVESTPNSIQNTIPGNDFSVDALMNLISNNNSSSSDHWLISTEEDDLPERPATPADEEVEKGYQKMMVCQFDTWHAYDSRTPLYYIMSRCFTTCVLYTSRTSANTAMVMRSLSGNARELVDTEVCRVISTPVEKLARSQALFLYQIMRLFDGDVTLRAQGEKDMVLLRTWLRELCHIRDNLGDLARLDHASVRDQSPVEWEKWIFAECIRRTILMAYAVIGLYELLKDPGFIDPDSAWAYAHRWTLGRSLWDACSSAEFQRAWKDSPHFIIANFAFENFLENGKGEDVDEFAEILLNVSMGVDSMKEFMAPQETRKTATQ